MGWLIALGVVVLLAVLPLGVSVKYNAEGALVRVILGPMKLTVIPRPKKEKKAKKTKESKEPKEPQEPKESKEPKEPKEQKAERAKPAEPALPTPQNPAPPPKPKEEKPKEEKGGSLLDFLPLVKVALNFLGDFRRKLRLNHLELKIIMAGGDPANLAINYGRAWAAVGNLMPQLERLFVIKKRDVEVECDFTASETLIFARLDLTIPFGRLLSLAVCYGIRALKEFLKIKKKRKGGANP